MKWITDEDLKIWSHRTEARELLIDLVGDLIRATIKDINKFRFPGQSSGTLRGFDGDLETTETISRVPSGSSKWEFGTSSAGKAKAQSDYEKRSQSTTKEVMAQNTLVMVNLHSWDTPSTTLVCWLAERKAEKKWYDIHYIDGTALVAWLEEHPAVAARYARNVLEKAPRSGALSTDEFWDKYSSGFLPVLNEKVLLCGRENEASQLLNVLTSAPQNFTLAADNSEEVIAFAVAAIRMAPDVVRTTLEDRTLIVENYEAAQFLLAKRNMVFLVWKEAEKLAGQLGQKGPTLTAATGVNRKRPGNPILKRPSASALAEAFESMGIERQEGHDLALKCGRSLTILQRLRPAAGTAKPQEWEGVAQSLKPALLAGGWSVDSDLDKDVVASLTEDDNYQSIEKVIRSTLMMSDPPFDRVDQVWQVRSAVDAFNCYGHLVDEHDLQRLKHAVIRVLGHRAVQPAEEDKFSFNYKAPSDYSNWLRDGLAYTLMLFAVMPDVGGLAVNSSSPQRYVDDVVRSLPDFAKSHKWILSLLEQLPLIAEASPIPFLEALESILEGDASEAIELFQEPSDRNYLFAKNSPHIYVLWALEVLAWDPKLLPRVTVILGKLASIDPNKDLNNGNRPIKSLREIFLPWSPATDANLNRRFVAIDSLIRLLPDVSWNLLLQLMPRSHDNSFPTSKPKLRDTAPLTPENITFGLVWEAETGVLERILKLANHEDQYVALVDYFSNMQTKNRERMLKEFEIIIRQNTTSEGCALWHKLNEFSAQHEKFADAEWSLKGDELVSIKTILDTFRPSDIVAQTRYLFDEWHPHLRTITDSDLEDVDIMRLKELQRIQSDLGVNGLIKLAQTVKIPRTIGQAFHGLVLSNEDAVTLIKNLLETGGDCYQLAGIISGRLKRHAGEAWMTDFKKFIVPLCESPKDVAWLLVFWPNELETWAYVRSLSREVADSYWRDFGTLPLNGNIENIQDAIEELRRVGCSAKVISTLRGRIDELNSESILTLLDETFDEISSANGSPQVFSYEIGEVFKKLATRDDISLKDIAFREYLYFPLIHKHVQNLAIHKLLAKEPTEYIGIIRDVFISRTPEIDTDNSEHKLTRAKLSYRILKSFHLIPGSKDDNIDESILRSWITEVRRLAAESGHTEITDLQLGELLAHSNPDVVTATWPPVEVAAVIENLESDDVERGILIERANMRGVFTKLLDEGGAQERTLAAQYREWAKQITYPRTCQLLETMASQWDEDAIQADISAEQGKLKR